MPSGRSQNLSQRMRKSGCFKVFSVDGRTCMQCGGRAGMARAGYSPACIKKGFFASKAEARANREFLPMTDSVIRDHLSGKLTAGVYPLMKDETCWFLAADFDKETWRDDASAFLQTCFQAGIPAYLERSRSGLGAHVWIFFEQATTASLARKLGAAMLTRTMETRHQIGLDSYDRLFPDRDTMPQGGFGNLIALPIQRGPRNEGNSVFIGDDFRPFSDQWDFLSLVQRLSIEQMHGVVREAERTGNLIGIRLSDPRCRRGGDRPVAGASFPEEKNGIHRRFVANYRARDSGQSGLCGEGRVAIVDAQPTDAAGCFSKPGVLPLAGHAAIHLRRTVRPEHQRRRRRGRARRPRPPRTHTRSWMRCRSRLSSSRLPGRLVATVAVGGQEQVERHLRIAQPTGGIQARGEAKADLAWYRGSRTSARPSPASAASPGRRKADSSRRPAATRMRFSSREGHQIRDGAQRDQIEQDPRIDGLGLRISHRAQPACARPPRDRTPPRTTRAP